MAKLRPKRPADPIKLAKLIGDIATGQVPEETASTPPPTSEELRRVMSALGKIGGPKGGNARAKSLTKARRVTIAKKAARARWRKADKKKG